MQRKMKQVLTAATAVILLGLAGCNNTATNTTDSTANEIAENQTINMMEINEISSMDSGNAMDGGSFIAITQVIEGLYNLDSEDQIIPGVATKLPTISEDGLTYTITLRDNAVWSNGTSVTADDFVYAWRRVVDPDFGAPSAFLMMNVKNASKILEGELALEELGVEAKDDHTLVITLEAPVAYFTSMLTFPTFFPVNQDYVEASGGDYAMDSEHLIYNGPYQLTDWQPSNQTWTYKKNETYWNKEQSNVEAVNIQVVKDTNLAYNLYQTGELDRAVLSGEHARQEKENPDYTTQLDSWVHVLELNNQGIFANTKARQAISLAIDRQHITDELLNNDSQPIYGLIPQQFVRNPETAVDFREESGDVQQIDVSKAKELWQEALKESGETEIKVELIAADQDENKAITEYLQYALEDTLPGLTVSISTLPEKSLLDRKEKLDYDLLLTRQGPDYQDPLTFLSKYQSEAFDNPSQYQNSDFDSLLARAATESTEPAARWQTLIDAEHTLLEDAGVVPLYQSANTALMRQEITGMIHHLFGPPNYYGKIMLEE